MVPTPTENEVMHRALKFIEQMLREVEGSARSVHGAP